jgi:hypothetical protein
MKTIAAVFVFASLQIILIEQVNAYIDPGTGSMVFQAILGILAAVSVSIGVFWRRIRLFIARLLNRGKSE